MPSLLPHRPTAAELNDGEHAHAVDGSFDDHAAPTTTAKPSGNTKLNKLIAVALKRAGSVEGVARLFDQLAVLA
ncbi:hypothetical protein LTR85_007781 [Meristemomyces frigidus]|nr:hypothetical protein LTR85_007781 [Meristemomyces frigidus]